MIKMKTIILFMLIVLIYPPSTTRGAEKIKNNVICNVAGAMFKTSFKLNIKDLPKCCDIINYGIYDLGGQGIMDEDKCAIKKLTDAGRTVYTRVGLTNSTNWTSIFEPTNETQFEEKILSSMVNVLKDSKINGIIIQILDLYDVEICDLAQKISQFVSKIKKECNELIVGMVFNGYYYQSFTNITAFDFSITNKVMEFYVIDMSHLNICEMNLCKTDVSPVTSKNPDLLTIEMVTNQVKQSRMDQSKIFAMIEVLVEIPAPLVEVEYYGFSTYSTYCSSTNKTNSSQWCRNTPTIFHDQGAYVKKSYDGIVIEQLDGDDYEGTCKCGKFPGTNAVLDGWEGKSVTNCSALN